MIKLDEHPQSRQIRNIAWWSALLGMAVTCVIVGYTLTSEQKARHTADAKLRLAMQGSEAGYYFWEISPASAAAMISGGNPVGTDYVWFSKQFCDNLGRSYGPSFDELSCDAMPTTLQSFLDILHPDDVSSVQKAVRAWFNSRGRVPYEAEYRLRTANGDYRWFVARGAGDFDMPHITLAGSVMPINELKRERLRMSRIVDSTPVALIMCDGDGRITSYNPAAEELLGWKASEIVGKRSASFFLLPPYREQHDGMMAKAKERLLMSGDSWQLTRRRVFGEAVKKNGTKMQIELTVRGISYDGVVEFIASLRDQAAPDIETKKLPDKESNAR